MSTDFLFGPAPHDEAVDFIRDKPLVTRDVFDGLLPELRARAFVVTGIESANVLQSVRDRIADLPAGHNWDDVKEDIVNDISPFIVDSNADPDHRDAQINAANRRAELLMRVHGFQAYQAASYQVMDAQKDVLPYWQYLSMEDDKVRPAHAALNKCILPANDPFWQLHYPPWGFGCRCQVVPLSQSDRDEQHKKDQHVPVDQRQVLEGPVLAQAPYSITRNGRTVSTIAPSQTGNSDYLFDPTSLRIPLHALERRYDPLVWHAFKDWSQKTTLHPGNPTTVWNWLSGHPAPAGPTPPIPPPPVTIPVPVVPGIVLRNPIGHLSDHYTAHTLSQLLDDTARAGDAHGIGLVIDMDPEDWNLKMRGTSPDKFVRSLLQGFLVPPGCRIKISGNQNYIGLDLNGDDFSISRKIRGTTVDHSYFQVEQALQGSGFSKKVFNNLVGLYDHMGLEKITVHANIDVGGYAWARYGFRADDNRMGQGALEDALIRLYQIKAQLPLEEYQDTKRLIESAQTTYDPEIYHKLASLSKIVQNPNYVSGVTQAQRAQPQHSIGKQLLLNSDWAGHVDLTDPKNFSQFANYAGYKGASPNP